MQRRRRPMLRIVLIALALAAVVEPIVMYRSLVHQRGERRASAELAEGR
jgi:hypothetical protein